MIEGCENCEHGWRRVDPDLYGERLFPMPEGASVAQAEEVYRNRAMYGPAVFPCRDCLPSQYDRWANGCFRAHHIASKCSLCVDALGESGARRFDMAGSR